MCIHLLCWMPKTSVSEVDHGLNSDDLAQPSSAYFFAYRREYAVLPLKQTPDSWVWNEGNRYDFICTRALNVTLSSC
jgi:hypothetical protein